MPRFAAVPPEVATAQIERCGRAVDRVSIAAEAVKALIGGELRLGDELRIAGGELVEGGGFGGRGGVVDVGSRANVRGAASGEMGAPAAASSEEPRSWGEALQQYARAKTQRPRPDSEYVKPERVTRYEKSRQEVEYHPILQSFRDAPREDAAKSLEATSRVSQLNKAKDKQIRVRVEKFLGRVEAQDSRFRGQFFRSPVGCGTAGNVV